MADDDDIFEYISIYTREMNGASGGHPTKRRGPAGELSRTGETFALSHKASRWNDM